MGSGWSLAHFFTEDVAVCRKDVFAIINVKAHNQQCWLMQSSAISGKAWKANEHVQVHEHGLSVCFIPFLRHGTLILNFMIRNNSRKFVEIRRRNLVKKNNWWRRKRKEAEEEQHLLEGGPLHCHNVIRSNNWQLMRDIITFSQGLRGLR